jgi:hypothetical protein
MVAYTEQRYPASFALKMDTSMAIEIAENTIFKMVTYMDQRRLAYFICKIIKSMVRMESCPGLNTKNAQEFH